VPNSPSSSPLSSFRLFEEIGSGSTGTVHRGVLLEDRWGAPAGSAIAVKFLHQRLTGDPAARARFLDEARAGLAISGGTQRHLVRMLAVCEEHLLGQDLLFLVMEHVPGPTLRAWLAREEAGNEPLVRDIGAQLAEALGNLHAAGVVHLDVKPENVILSAGPRAVLMDLGYARDLGSHGARGARTFAGSPTYAAPELLRGVFPTPACDLYSLGVLLFELATRCLPFRATEPDALLEEKLQGHTQRASQRAPSLSPFLDEVLESLLAPDPRKRFPSAHELARVLRAGERSPWWAQREKTARAVRAKHDDPLPLFGREAELGRLLESAHDALGGQRRFALVLGETHMGGQRLLVELEHRLASTEPAPQVLEGRCPPPDEAVPYAGLLSALERFLGLARGVRPTQADLARLAAFSTPSVARVLGSALVGAETAAESSDGTLTLPRAFCALLRGLSRHRPLVLQLEDFHHVGTSTLRTLELLLEEQDGLPILVLALARPTKIVESRAVQHFLERLRTRGQLLQLELAPLDKASLGRSLGRILPADLDAEPFVEALLERTGGMPAYVAEVLKALEREGVLQWSEGRLVPQRDIAAIPLPERLIAGARRRREELPEELRQELDRAAVAGVRFEVELLAEAFGEEPLAHAQRLGRLEIGRDILVPQGAAYRFASQGVHEVLYESIDPAQRRAIHSALADALTRRAQRSDPGTRGILEIAHHAGAAGEHRRALEWLQAMLRRPRRGLSPELATTLCQTALRHLEALGASVEGAAERRLEWLLHLAEAAGRAGKRNTERGAAEKAFREARRLGRTADQARALYMLGRHSHRTSNNELALEYLERALEIAPPSETEIRLRIRIGMGVAWGYIGMHREARQHLDAADAEIADAPRAAHLSLRVAQARNRLDIHRPGEALDILESALPELRRSEDTLLYTRALFQQARALDDTGSYDAALEVILHALELEREHGDRRLRATLRSLEGDVRTKLGDFRGALAALDDALLLARSIGDRYTRVHCWIHLTHAHLSRRNPQPDPRRALATAKRAVRLADDLDNPRHQAAALSAQARVLLRLDRLAAARALSQRALELHRRTRQDARRRIAVLYTHWAIVERLGEPDAQRWMDRALQLAAGLAKRLHPPERRARFIREERLVRKILRACRERGRSVPPILAEASS
jgi:predicted ATPase